MVQAEGEDEAVSFPVRASVTIEKVKFEISIKCDFFLKKGVPYRTVKVLLPLILLLKMARLL